MIQQSEDGACVGRNLRPQFGGFLGDGASDSATLGFTLIIHDHSSVVLTVDEGTVGSSPGSSLSDDDGGVDFLSGLVVTLLHRADHNITNGS